MSSLFSHKKPILFFLCAVFTLSILASLGVSQILAGDDPDFSRSDDAPRLIVSEDQNAKGGLVNLASSDEPVIEVGSWNLSGEADITLYQANEDFLFSYLLHDADGKQITQPSSSQLQQVANFKTYVQQGYGSGSRVTLPLTPTGIWYMTLRLNGQTNHAMIVRSRIGGVVRKGDTKLIIWGQSYENKRHLTSGTVRSINLLSQKTEQGRTTLNSEGLAELPLTVNTDIVVVEQGEDRAIVPVNLKYLNTGYAYSRFQPRTFNPKYFAFTDRPLYRPGDKLYFKAIVRDDDDGRYSIPQGTATVKVFRGWESKDPVFEKIIAITAQGTVSGEFELPEDLLTGYYTLNIKVNGQESTYDFQGSITEPFQVEHFRKPEYSIDVNTSTQEIIKGDSASFAIEGTYFSGQALAHQEVSYKVFTYDLYEYEYFMERESEISDTQRYLRAFDHVVTEGKATLDEKGKVVVPLDSSKFESSGKTQIYTIEAEYKDISGNPSFARKNIIVRPGHFQVFRQESQYTGRVNQLYSLPLKLHSIRGESTQNIEVTAKLKQTHWEKDLSTQSKYPQYKPVEETLPDISAKTNTQGEVVLAFTPKKQGSLTFTVEAHDTHNNIIKKEFGGWVMEENAPLYSATYTSNITLSSNKPSYSPGETARITIYSEIPDRDLFLSLQRNRVDRSQVVQMTGKTATVDLLIEDQDMPNVNVRAASFSNNTLDGASLNLLVSANKKKVKVELTPDREKYGPGDTVTLNIQTTDFMGNPVSADVAVWTIDKSLLELAYGTLGNIFDTFWSNRYGYAPEAHSLENINVQTAEGGGCFVSGTQVLMADGSTKNIEAVQIGEKVLTRVSEDDPTLVTAKVTGTHHTTVDGYLAINHDFLVTEDHIVWVNGVWKEAGSIQKGDIIRNSKNEPLRVTSIEWLTQKTQVHNLTIEKYHTYFANNIWVHNDKDDSDARSIFKDTAYWNPSVQTDGAGKAEIRFKLPDNLTTWVIAGVADTTDTKVGQATAEIQVAKDIVVRPSLPNVLRIGDKVELSALVHNFSDQDQVLDIDLDFPAGRVQTATFSGRTIKAKSSEQVFWHVSPDQEDPKAQLHFRAKSSDPKLSDEVITTLPVEKFGFIEKRVQVADQPTTFTLQLAPDADKEKTEIRLSLASSIVGTLPSSLKYLIDYPYGCVEQTTSRFVPAVLAKSDSAFFSESIEGRNLDEIIKKGIQRLVEKQQPDGGWAWWDTTGSDPFVTSYVVEYILLAKSHGAQVPNDTLERARSFLKQNGHYDPKSQSFVSDEYATKVVKTYGLSLLGDEGGQQYLNGENDKLSSDLLAMAVITNTRNGYKDPSQNGGTQLMAKAQQQGDSLFWPASPSKQFGSIDASTALAMRAILAGGGQRDDAVKAARYLLNNRKTEYWSNTFGTAQVLRSSLELAKTGGELSPNYTYQVLLDGEVLKQGSVTSAQQVIKDIVIPVDKVQSSGSTLSIQKTGEGQVYSTLLEKEFHTDKETQLASKTLSLKREYTNDRGPEHPISVGDIITVNLTVSGLKTEEQYAVIEDTLPTGMIPINTHLKNEQFLDNMSTPAPAYESGISDQETTLNGVVLSLYRIKPDTQVYTYKARVIAAGDFAIPPAHAELMYSPEIFANSQAEVITIKPQSAFVPFLEPIKNIHNKAASLITQAWIRYLLIFICFMAFLTSGLFVLAKTYHAKMSQKLQHTNEESATYHLDTQKDSPDDHEDTDSKS